MVTLFQLHSQCSGSVWPVWMYSSCSVTCLINWPNPPVGWAGCGTLVVLQTTVCVPCPVPRYGSNPCECALVHKKGITAVLAVEGNAVLLNVASFHPEAPVHRRIPVVSLGERWRSLCAAVGRAPLSAAGRRGVDPQRRSTVTGEMQEQLFLLLPCRSPALCGGGSARGEQPAAAPELCWRRAGDGNAHGLSKKSRKGRCLCHREIT